MKNIAKFFVLFTALFSGSLVQARLSLKSIILNMVAVFFMTLIPSTGSITLRVLWS